MATKKITDLQLISALTGSENLPIDDGIETYRCTGLQLYNYMRTKFQPNTDELSNVAVAVSVGSSALTIALKTLAGNDPSSTDPVRVSFRNATVTSGGYVSCSVTSALSVVVSSGSTLGHISGLDHYIYVYLINNAGTPELAVSTVAYDQGTVLSTTAEGGAGAADSNHVVYSTASRSNVACRLIARLKSNQVTAGTWAAAPTEVSIWPFDIKRIKARYYTNTADATTGAGAFGYHLRREDTHNAYDSSTGKFTAPKTSNYLVTARILTGSSQALYVVNNGSTLVAQGNTGAAGASSVSMVSTTTFLNQGDTTQVNTTVTETVSGTEVHNGIEIIEV